MPAPFTALTAVAAPLDLLNVDTDQLLPARFLRYPREQADYDQFLLHDLRFDEAGAPDPGFVLNDPRYREAQILVGTSNFGCGSARTGAVWALAAAGFRAVVAASFAGIFEQNCLQDGLLPVILGAAEVAALRRKLAAEPGTRLAIDLERQTVAGPDGKALRFDIDPYEKHKLLSGLDDVSMTAGYLAQIEAFESRVRREAPWRWALTAKLRSPEMEA
jgi:3-isopropylmalate/(R)-2-methylmalate dehydratase small subunit